ncbi:hypothetical protein AB0H77_40490 [Streptomyces sp. NPDC050844]|uniref:hypothetical protein n=1 Tax=Streptomyces sp. NPDC050844 TaxID=3155790 RepID=UPI0033C84C4B
MRPLTAAGATKQGTNARAFKPIRSRRPNSGATRCGHSKESVTVDDIAGESLPRALDPAWNALWRIDPRPDGSTAPGGPLVDAVEDKVELVAGGEAVAIIPATTR